MRALLALLAFAAAFLLAGAAAPLAAQEAPPRTVSAAEPGDLVLALLNAGYDPDLGKDEYGDPLIGFRRPDGYFMQLFFYDCDEETREDCGSLQLRAGFDREEAWDPAASLAIARRFRFASVWLDDEGDPWIKWDILTRGGIPETPFVDAVENFERTVEEVAAIVFAEESEAGDAGEGATDEGDRGD
ncbi:YbjN domain-containing protein [Erythrobacter sp. HL-111]|uniref:YbjN domain-containing protein n=1 Tax=Erythrobacter sp. HL-111 TaxID=1798193 RepID=UPI0006DA7E48|nr:MAG: putative bacterial sensory transduction regulator [Erythrobacteraceae bacterium HL-111]SDS08505.1 hypothetical protein SAMN04515621_0927 [Erythrobacter sp. HL-111]